MFAIFNGLLISFDYILCVLLVFPALILYDKWMVRSRINNTRINCCVSCFDGRKNPSIEETQHEQMESFDDTNKDASEPHDPNGSDEMQAQRQGYESPTEAKNLIQRILLSFLKGMFFLRYAMVVLILGSFIGACYGASRLKLPDTSEVRLLNEKSEYEVNHIRRQELLFSSLKKQSGGQGYVIWGVEAADTGNINNPGKK
jgi:hypothetical protein